MDISNISRSSLQRPDPTQMRQQLFTKADTDSSGTITKQELTDAISSMPKPPGGNASEVDTMFSKMDTDGSGDVTEAEHDSFLDARAADRAGPPPAREGFEGSTDTLKSLLAALQKESDETTSVDDLLARLVAFLKDETSGYSADGAAPSSETKSLFETDA